MSQNNDSPDDTPDSVSIDDIRYDTRKWPHRAFDAIKDAFENRGWILNALVMCVELIVAVGIAGLIEHQIYAAVSRASGQELSMAGVLVSLVALAIGVVIAAIFYWKVHTAGSFGMWLVLILMAIAAIGSGLVKPLMQNDAARHAFGDASVTPKKY